MIQRIKPIRANWEITNLCNLRCLHCYFFSNNSSKEEGLSFSKIKKLINKLSKEGIFELSIGGGEPFCFEKIKEVLLLATSKMYVIVATNGLLLDKEKIDFLSKLPNFSLQISLDGKEENHRRIRNISSKTFRKLNKIIKECVSKKIDLRIGFMLCHLNVADVDSIYKYCERNKIRKMTVLPYIGEVKTLKLNTEDVNRTVRSFRKYIDKLEIKFRDPVLKFLITGKKGECEGGTLTFNINHKGDVSLCCYLDNSYIGNIFDIKIEKISYLCDKKIGKINRSICSASNLYKEINK